MAAIVRVENLSKQYRFGGTESAYSTLRDALVEVTRAPLNRFRRNGSSSVKDDKVFWALKDITFEVEQGEILGIVGRNGAGKSTLLKILSRITEPTAGRIELYGRVGSLLEVGTGFHPELTGRENILLNGAILGMRREEIERKFDEIVAFAELEQFLDTPVKRYSSGMYVRLAFAVAAHLESEILIIDEVLAVGDTKFQKKCLGKMGEAARGGRTVLVVSHNLGIVSTLCTSAIYLADGMLRAQGSPDEIITGYLSETLENKVHDLERLRFTGMGQRIRFLDIRLANPDNNVEYGHPLEFVLTIQSDVDLEGLSIGSTIFSMTGTGVGSLVTREEFSIAAEQQLILRLRVSNVGLAPGSYYSGFSIGRGGRQGTRADLDALIGAPTFQVLPLSNTDDPIANWHRSWGSVVFKDTCLTIENGKPSSAPVDRV
jgi:lipopolysaccharide transport system ATP-binding protein